MTAESARKFTLCNSEENAMRRVALAIENGLPEINLIVENDCVEKIKKYFLELNFYVQEIKKIDFYSVTILRIRWF